MLSPVKAITAGALVFALGGAFLIAQPFGQQGSSAPGAETGDAGAATWVTGDITPEWDCTGLTFEMVGTVRHERGQRCGPHKWTTSDPRLSGDVTEMWNADVYQMEDGFISNFAFAYFVTNEAGGWTCHSDAIAEGYGVSPDFVTGETTTCVGDGGYEGLSATLVLDTWGEGSLVGLVFPGDGPPRPEPAAE